MNNLVLSGRLTSAPELKTTGSGVNYTNITIAIDRDYKDKTGEKVTDFFDITVWRQSAEFITQYCNKGDIVSVVGQLQKRSYDKDGKTIWTTDIIADKVNIVHRNKQEAVYEAPKPKFELDPELPF